MKKYISINNTITFLGQLISSFILMGLLYASHTPLTSYTDGYISFDGFFLLAEAYSPSIVLTHSAISWFVIPTILTILVYFFEKSDINKQTKELRNLALIDAVTWYTMLFLIALPQFIFDDEYIFSWIFGLVVLSITRFIPIFIISFVQLLGIRFVIFLKKKYS